MWYEMDPRDPKHHAIVHDGAAEFIENLDPTPQEEVRDLEERLTQEVPPDVPYLGADEWDCLKGTASPVEIAAMSARLAELRSSAVAPNAGHLALAKAS